MGKTGISEENYMQGNFAPVTQAGGRRRRGEEGEGKGSVELYGCARSSAAHLDVHGIEMFQNAVSECRIAHVLR